MKQIRTRRAFFAQTRNLIAAGGLSGMATLHATPAPDRVTAEGEDYYDKLGVAKIINAAGTYTILTASIMPPSVQAAVARAAQHPVRLLELQTKAGAYLAKQLRAEAAMVTAGAASALTLGTAACMMVANKCSPHEVPGGAAGMKNEVIVQKTHRYGYDHALSNCGIRFVEVESLADYEAAFHDRTVMAHFFNAAERGQIGREDWIRVAHKHGVPCFNDAAADVPPISNLWNYTQMGFDLVTFSGGKGIRGPQNAGLLLGRKDLIAAAVMSNNPYDDCVGRGMKVAKEQIVGMVAAVDWFLSQSDDRMQAEFQARADRITAHLKDLPTLETRTVVPPVANQVPHLLIRYDQQRLKISPLDVKEQLRRGTPSIELNPATGTNEGSAGLPSDANTIVVGVWMLQPDEDMIVARRLREVLLSAA
ncbi:MAG TPA: aminotransferase class V-fold PLP-dependent enzyme [Bryobacteraceae bacterium]|jgi:L-seryl-tRNA(Ser) seleniumtransferase|nr:aminotransferase class V-fold PLP-dependent enzyme [Bryobacteraceae bacterium]